MTKESVTMKQSKPQSEDSVSNLNDLWTPIQNMFHEHNAQIESIINLCKEKFELRISKIETGLKVLKNECTAKILQIETAMIDFRRDLDATIDRIARTEKQNELIISNVPFFPDEDLKTVFCRIGMHLDYATMDMPTVKLKRLSKTPIFAGLSPPILCQFLTRSSRDAFFVKYLKRRDLNQMHLGCGSTGRVYINENLTADTRSILAKAINLKREGFIERTIVRDGIVSVVRQGKVIRIENRQQLLNLSN